MSAPLQVVTITLTPDELRALIRAGVDEAMRERDATSAAAPATPQASEWIDAKHAAALLRVSSRYVTGLAKKGTLPASRIGKLLRFRRVDVETMMSARRTA